MTTVLECLSNKDYSGGVRQITKQQAILVGLPWPLQPGWKDWCSSCYIEENNIEEFKSYDREQRQTKNCDNIIPFAERLVKAKEKQFSDMKSDFYKTQAWRELRYAAIKNYGGVCACCGRSRSDHGIVIHVDHIKPRSRHPDLALCLDNLQLLCEDCNMGKLNKDSLVWSQVKSKQATQKQKEEKLVRDLALARIKIARLKSELAAKSKEQN